MSSTYNSRPLIPEVLINAGDFAVIRRRQSVEEAMNLEQIPDWLDDPAAPNELDYEGPAA
jgi:diaminopimelate decarboxylase